jgi:uncharacterized protein YqcC (DUF446 family)
MSRNASILPQLSAQLSEIEAELRRLEWWSDQPPDLLAEVAAGRLKSYLDAPSFELWLQCVFLPNARARVAEGDLPAGSSVGEMARRQYDYHSSVEEAKPLLGLLRRFDELVLQFHQPPPPKAGPPPVIPPEMEAMFAQSRGLLIHWLDLTEVHLQKLGWWDDDTGESPVAYAQWMRQTFLPEVRASLRQGIVPASANLAGESARRLAAEQRTVPEELAPLLSNFDEGVSTYHMTWNLCGLPPAVPVAGASVTPPEYTGEFQRVKTVAAPRVRLAPAPVEALGFEVILEEARGLLMCVLDCIESALEELPPDLPAPAGGEEEPVEDWLAEVFLPDVREWLEKGQVPQESGVAASAEQEFSARGVLVHTTGLLDALRAFDERVSAYHQLSLTLPQQSAGARMAAAWRLIMARPELRTPVAPEPDAVRLQSLLILNRIEAELHLLGWWRGIPESMPESFRDVSYAGKHATGIEPPRFELWIQSSFLPRMRESIQTCTLPDISRLRDEANRALSEGRLGSEKFRESRRLYKCFDELDTLVHRAHPAAMQRHQEARRRRGLTPPSRQSAKDRESAQAKIDEHRNDVAEALRLAVFELKSLGWWGCDAGVVRAQIEGIFESAAPPPFEHWLEAVYIPETRARLKDGRVLEERRASDYVAWECQCCGQTEAARELLKQLEKVDHWSAYANRAQRDQWTE